jgi:hypothetical protein
MSGVDLFLCFQRSLQQLQLSSLAAVMIFAEFPRRSSGEDQGMALGNPALCQTATRASNHGGIKER